MTLGRVGFVGGEGSWAAYRALRDALDGEQAGPLLNWMPMPTPKNCTPALWSLVTEHAPLHVLVNYQPALVPPEVLKSASIAINLHTGPPEWPGRGSCSWALLNGDTSFGVTAHLMTERFDDGPILTVRRFDIDPSWDAEALHKRTLGEIPLLARDVIEKLREVEWDGAKAAFGCPERWARKPKTLKELGERMVVTCEEPYTTEGRLLSRLDQRALDQYIRAFGYTGKKGPGIRIGNRIFWYEKGAK